MTTYGLYSARDLPVYEFLKNQMWYPTRIKTGLLDHFGIPVPTQRHAVVHNQLQAKDDCWRIDALYKLQPNKVHSKKMQYMKVHHGEVHHKEVHHEEVQLKLQRHKSDRQ